MSIFTYWSRPAGLMLDEASSPFRIPMSRQRHAVLVCCYCIKVYHAVKELWTFWLKDLDQPKWYSVKPCHRFAKLDPTIPCGSRVMNIFTNCTRRARMMLSKVSSNQKRWLCMSVFILCCHAKFDHNIPCGLDLWAFTLTANGGMGGQTDRRTYSDYSAHLPVVQLKSRCGTLLVDNMAVLYNR